MAPIPSDLSGWEPYRHVYQSEISICQGCNLVVPFQISTSHRVLTVCTFAHDQLQCSWQCATGNKSLLELMFTPGTLMTSAAADVISHNGRKIGRFKPLRFCYVRMTSAQSWSRRHHWFEPTSSLPICKGLYLVIYKTSALIFPVQLKVCLKLYLCKNPSRNMPVYSTKSSRFETTVFASVMIDDVGCSRRQQCPRCECWPCSMSSNDITRPWWVNTRMMIAARNSK